MTIETFGQKVKLSDRKIIKPKSLTVNIINSPSFTIRTENFIEKLVVLYIGKKILFVPNNKSRFDILVSLNIFIIRGYNVSKSKISLSWENFPQSSNTAWWILRDDPLNTRSKLPKA